MQFLYKWQKKKHINWECNAGILIKNKPENRAQKKTDLHPCHFFQKLICDTQ